MGERDFLTLIASNTPLVASGSGVFIKCKKRKTGCTGPGEPFTCRRHSRGYRVKRRRTPIRSWMEAIHYCLRIQRRVGREAAGGCSDGDGVAVRDGAEGEGCSEGDYR